MEVELRVMLKEGKDKVEQFLTENGFIKKGEKKQEDFYFRHKSDLVEKKGILRIRIVDGKDYFYLTSKVSNDNIDDNWKEVEIRISIGEVETMKELVRDQGFVEDVIIKKMRITFVKNDITVNIDKIDDLGDYMEVEIISDDVESARKEINTLLNKMGFSDEDIVRRGYVGLMRDKKKGGV